ncbi:F-box protein SNE-like [Chenopodium quinoa]|nr:F-box protein SNE-like [Chenopodium quinoa]
MLKREATIEYSINDYPDILVEVLKRLDGRSLGVASCVCRLWWSISKSDDSVWEYVCFRRVSPPPRVRTLVLALGGYKRLYMVCVRPVLGRWNGSGRSRCGAELTRRVWSRQGAQLLLSLFCVDYYEKLGSGGGGGGGGRIGSDAVPSSLMFLCKPVNV